jgi:hypothetical protein
VGEMRNQRYAQILLVNRNRLTYRVIGHVGE